MKGSLLYGAGGGLGLSASITQEKVGRLLNHEGLRALTISGLGFELSKYAGLSSNEIKLRPRLSQALTFEVG